MRRWRRMLTTSSSSCYLALKLYIIIVLFLYRNVKHNRPIKITLLFVLFYSILGTWSWSNRIPVLYRMQYCANILHFQTFCSIFTFCKSSLLLRAPFWIAANLSPIYLPSFRTLWTHSIKITFSARHISSSAAADSSNSIMSAQ